VIEARGYTPLLIRSQRSLAEEYEVYETIACADLALCCVDAAEPESYYLLGAARSAFLPTIAITVNGAYEFDPKVPQEYQPRVLPAETPDGIRETLTAELDTYEEDFVELEDQDEVEKYTSMLVDVAPPSAGLARSQGVYPEGIRNFFVQELVMRDQYKGQMGAAGPGAHAHDMHFQQVWQEMGSGADTATLAKELAQLRTALKQEATSPEHDATIGAVAAAEVAAQQGDGPGAL
jgi:hypothetical protein